MKNKFSPGMIICILGFSGLMFSLIDKSGEIGSKIPLTLFFLVIVIIGLVLEMTPKEKLNDIYGESEGKNRFR